MKTIFTIIKKDKAKNGEYFYVAKAKSTKEREIGEHISSIKIKFTSSMNKNIGQEIEINIQSNNRKDNYYNVVFFNEKKHKDSSISYIYKLFNVDTEKVIMLYIDTYPLIKEHTLTIEGETMISYIYQKIEIENQIDKEEELHRHFTFGVVK